MIALALEDDYLATFLQPLAPLLDDPSLTDLFVNAGCAVWAERTDGSSTRYRVPGIDEDWLWHLSRQIAFHSSQAISRSQPLLTASLPDGTRVQVVAPPATRKGFAIAFRRQAVGGFGMSDLKQRSFFARPATRSARMSGEDLSDIYNSGDMGAFLCAAVRARKTIVVSGGTSSGKTTLANAILREVPGHERIVTIEDAAELEVSQPNHVGLIASRSGASECDVSIDDLLLASLRLRPDRIVLGELRGGEALTFLRAINSGHPGSVTTIHADSCEGALDQLAFLALQSGPGFQFTDLRNYVERAFDVVVQVARYGKGRGVSDVLWLTRPGGK